MKRLIFILLFFLPASLSALSPDFKMTKFGNFVHFEGMPNSLYFFKNIQKGDSFELRKALRNLNIDTIILSSPGGLVLEGLQMSGIIHDKGLTTYIPTGGECASACAFMFFAGDTRISDGELGVHQISSGTTESKKTEEIGTTEVISQYAVSEIIGFLREYDTPPFVYEKMFQQQEMYYFSREELNQIENKGPKYSRKKLTDMDNFLISFNDFLDILECANDASVCKPVQLCQMAFEGNSWSSQSDALPFVLEAQKQGLNCSNILAKAFPKISGKELIQAIQEELVRLGCTSEDSGHGKYPNGSIHHVDVEAVKFILNFDGKLSPETVSFDNYEFLIYLETKQDDYCKRKIAYYVDSWDQNFQFSNFMLFFDINLSTPLDAQFGHDKLNTLAKNEIISPGAGVHPFDKPLNFVELGKNGIWYAVKLERTLLNDGKLNVKFRVYNIPAGRELTPGTQLNIALGNESGSQMKLGRAVAKFVINERILSRKLDADIEAYLSEQADFTYWSWLAPEGVYRSAYLKNERGKYQEACSMLDFLQKQHPFSRGIKNYSPQDAKYLNKGKVLMADIGC